MPVPSSYGAPYPPSPAVSGLVERDLLLTKSRSVAFLEAVEYLRLYARHREPIVIEGESGTGKSVLARHVHEWSPRAKRELTAVSLATVPKSLAASALFGHVPGAYTSAEYSRDGYFCAANNGTLFLDELGRSTLALQRNLLEVVETGRLRPVGSDTEVLVDVRLIFATSVPMKELVAKGRLLLEIYARIRTLTVRLPALRERPEDIPDLAELFLARHAVSHGYSEAPVFAREVFGALCRAEWPLNVRELESAIVALVIHAHPARKITLQHFKGEFLQQVLTSAGRKRKRRSSEEVRRVFYAVNRNVTRTAEILGVNPPTVRSHLKRSGNMHIEREPTPRSG